MNSEPDKIQVMTVDDHEIMRVGIRYMLMAFDDLVLVGEAKRGEDAVKRCQEVKPDVVLVDMRMSGMDGIQTTEAIKAACGEVEVLILTSFHDPDLVRRAVKVGASGYLLKDSSKEDLAAAIRAAWNGQSTFSDEAARDLVTESGSSTIELTEREQEVLKLVVQGMSNKQIGQQLHRSPYTIRHHVSQLIRKLDAANRAEVAVIAVEQGLIRRGD